MENKKEINYRNLSLRIIFVVAGLLVGWIILTISTFVEGPKDFPDIFAGPIFDFIFSLGALIPVFIIGLIVRLIFYRNKNQNWKYFAIAMCVGILFLLVSFWFGLIGVIGYFVLIYSITNWPIKKVKNIRS